MSWFSKSSTSTPYDVIIHIQSLIELTKSGWRITKNNELKNMSSLIVGMLGSYNRGKSYLLNQLCRTQFPSGRLLPTEGISITKARETVEHMIFMDTAGTDTPVKQAELDDKRATEALLREVILHLCSYVIIVLNRLHLTDQIYMREVLDYCSKLSQSERPEIILVHNLMDLEKDEDIRKVIKTEIQGILGAELTTARPQRGQSVGNLTMYYSTYAQTNLRHFVLAKEGSEAGRNWNKQSLDGIMNVLQIDVSRRRNVDVIDKIVEFINTKLPQLFANDIDGKTDLSSLQVVKHEKEPYIVLTDLKELSVKERLEQPAKLKVSPALLYNKRGYLIGIYSEDIRTWQPRYRRCESAEYVKVIIELAGFNEDDVSIEIDKTEVVVKGERPDFTEESTKASDDRIEIPIGPFELHVSINCDVDCNNAKLECVDGLFTITFPKTINTKISLGKKSKS